MHLLIDDITVRQSFSCCNDRLRPQAFWGSMQIELLNRKRWRTKIELSIAIAEWIEHFYNPERLHSAIGYVPPEEFGFYAWSQQHPPRPDSYNSGAENGVKVTGKMQVSGTKVTYAFGVSGGAVREVSVSGLTWPILGAVVNVPQFVRKHSVTVLCGRLDGQLLNLFPCHIEVAKGWRAVAIFASCAAKSAVSGRFEFSMAAS